MSKLLEDWPSSGSKHNSKQNTKQQQKKTKQKKNPQNNFLKPSKKKKKKSQTDYRKITKSEKRIGEFPIFTTFNPRIESEL